VKETISADVAAFVADMIAKGPPFGAHTFAVVLADRVHQWGDGLPGLLTMVGPGGIGTYHPFDRKDGERIPVIVSASLAEEAGTYLATKETELVSAWARFLTIGPFSPQEAVTAYNWTLLHPWGGHWAYVANDDATGRWDNQLRDGWEVHYPRNLETSLYERVRWAMAEENPPIHRIDSDDDQAITQYEEQQ
jgi:hypothetical protein